MDRQSIWSVGNLCWNCSWLCARNSRKWKEKSESCTSRLLCECNDIGRMGRTEEVKFDWFLVCVRHMHPSLCTRYTYLVYENVRLNFRFPLRMENQTEIPVYNYIYDVNNLTWGKYMRLVRKGLHQPLDKAFWYWFCNLFILTIA